MEHPADKYGIKGIRELGHQNALSAVADALEKEQVKPQFTAQDQTEPNHLTTRERIAKLIRELTYRELKQIGDELHKNSATIQGDSPEEGTFDMAQTLDDWAHMVKDEGENHDQ